MDRSSRGLTQFHQKPIKNYLVLFGSAKYIRGMQAKNCLDYAISLLKRVAQLNCYCALNLDSLERRDGIPESSRDLWSLP